MLPPWPEPDAQTLKLLPELAAVYRLLTDAAIQPAAPSPADAPATLFRTRVNHYLRQRYEQDKAQGSECCTGRW
ncbi:MAG: hypothetical protein JO122_17575 [Acetobacteraceae bacterium]|nr:hypothetical protein [Acetobacteraceae bacterium]